MGGEPYRVHPVRITAQEAARGLAIPTHRGPSHDTDLPTARRSWYTDAMPIYEFICDACEAQFEELVRNGGPITCPACSSQEVRRLFSKFAVHSSTPGFA